MALNAMIVTGGRTPIGRYAARDFSTKTKIDSDEAVWLSIYLCATK